MTHKENREMITLRLKKNTETVLPEAYLVAKVDRAYAVRWEGDDNVTYFGKNYWEPVPPPYELPSGMGAVVECSLYYTKQEPVRFVRIREGMWISPNTGFEIEYAHLKTYADSGRLTTLSEGVEL